MGGKPSGSKLRRDAQDEDLGDGHHRLPGEEQPELVRAGGEHLDPAAQASAEAAQENGQPETLEKDTFHPRFLV